MKVASKLICSLCLLMASSNVDGHLRNRDKSDYGPVSALQVGTFQEPISSEVIEGSISSCRRQFTFNDDCSPGGSSILQLIYYIARFAVGSYFLVSAALCVVFSTCSTVFTSVTSTATTYTSTVLTLTSTSSTTNFQTEVSTTTVLSTLVTDEFSWSVTTTFQQIITEIASTTTAIITTNIVLSTTSIYEETITKSSMGNGRKRSLLNDGVNWKGILSFIILFKMLIISRLMFQK
jgi:hypothetical protein